MVVLSYWLWQSWFGSDQNVIGKSYTFANQNRAIIGVMRPEFRFPDERVAFWVPMTIRAAQVTAGGFGPRMLARLAPGTERGRLAAELEPLARRVQQRLGGPAPYVRIMEHHRPIVKPLREHLVGKILTPLWILLGAVGRRCGPQPADRRGSPSSVSSRTSRWTAASVTGSGGLSGSGPVVRRSNRKPRQTER